MDAATWAFNLPTPGSVEVVLIGNKGSADIAPYMEIGYYQFGANVEQPPFKLTWYSGGLRPALSELLPRDVTLVNRGAMFIGDKGIILNNGGASSTPQIFPESLRDSFTPPTPSIPAPKGTTANGSMLSKVGRPALSNFEYGASLTEIVLLGVLSLRLGGKKIYWDAANMKAIGLPEADENHQGTSKEKGWEMV